MAAHLVMDTLHAASNRFSYQAPQRRDQRPDLSGRIACLTARYATKSGNK